MIEKADWLFHRITAVIILYFLGIALFTGLPEQSRIPVWLVFAAAFPVVLLVMRFRDRLGPLWNRLMLHPAALPLIVLLGIAARVIWIAVTPTEPKSDFSAYDAYARAILQGNFHSPEPTYVLFPFKFTFPWVLAFFYKIAGPGNTAVGLMAVLSALICMGLLWLCARELFGRVAGTTALLLFAFWPAQITYCTVAASEHVFLPLFLLSMYLLIRGAGAQGRRMLILFGCFGVTVALTQLIRPVALMMWPACGLFLLHQLRTPGWLKTALHRIVIPMAVALAFFGLTLFAVNAVMEPTVGAPVWRASSGFSFLVGTNLEAGGRYNKQDEAIITRFGYDYNKTHSEATREAFERIRNNPAGFLRMQDTKFRSLWSSESFSRYWSTSGFLTPGTFWEKHPGALVLLVDTPTQLWYLLILALAALALFRLRDFRGGRTTVPLLIILGYTAAFMLFEVQDRYHYPALPLLFIFISSLCVPQHAQED